MAYTGKFTNVGRITRETFLDAAKAMNAEVTEHLERFVTNTQETRYQFTAGGYTFKTNNVWLWIAKND